MRTATRTASAIVGAILVLGACSSTSDNSTPTGPKASASVGDPTEAVHATNTPTDRACKLVTKQEASALFGVTAAPKPESVDVGAASVCMWRGEDAARHAYLLQIHIYDDAKHYGGDTTEVFPDKRQLPGLGDKAFVSAGNAQRGTDIQWVKNGRTYSIHYDISNADADTPKNTSSQVAALVALAKANQGRA